MVTPDRALLVVFVVCVHCAFLTCHPHAKLYLRTNSGHWDIWFLSVWHSHHSQAVSFSFFLSFLGMPVRQLEEFPFFSFQFYSSMEEEYQMSEAFHWRDKFWKDKNKNNGIFHALYYYYYYYSQALA